MKNQDMKNEYMKDEYMKNENTKTISQLHSKRVVITGGTSGLGLQLAIQLLERGARVAVIARTKENLEKLSLKFPQLVAIQGDVSKKEDIHPMAAQVESLLGGADILINGASTLGPTPLRLLIDTQCEDLEHVLQTNLVGPFRLTKFLLPGMLLAGRGVVVNVSSDAAVNAYPTWGAYGVSKAASDHLTKIFAAEMNSLGVHFLALDPGDMRTPMHFAAVPTADPNQLRDPREVAGSMLAMLEAELGALENLEAPPREVPAMSKVSEVRRSL